MATSVLGLVRLPGATAMMLQSEPIELTDTELIDLALGDRAIAGACARMSALVMPRNTVLSPDPPLVVGCDRGSTKTEIFADATIDKEGGERRSLL